MVFQDVHNDDDDELPIDSIPSLSIIKIMGKKCQEFQSESQIVKCHPKHT